jgi:hypothetical protein
MTTPLAWLNAPARMTAEPTPEPLPPSRPDPDDPKPLLPPDPEPPEPPHAAAGRRRRADDRTHPVRRRMHRLEAWR